MIPLRIRDPFRRAINARHDSTEQKAAHVGPPRDSGHFLRIHRSLIVNMRRIKELQLAEHGEYVVVLEGGVRLQSGRTYHDRIKSATANPW